MKLIIDIPEEVYEYWKEHKYEYVLSEAIANGIPYEPKGDLISREDLKQMLPAPVEDEYKRVHQIIDNAPTVDTTCQNFRQVAERPQGEWVLAYCSCGDRYYTCSICNRVIEVKNGQSIKDYPFCHCGAKMKGGAE